MHPYSDGSIFRCGRKPWAQLAYVHLWSMGATLLQVVITMLHRSRPRAHAPTLPPNLSSNVGGCGGSRTTCSRCSFPVIVSKPFSRTTCSRCSILGSQLLRQLILSVRSWGVSMVHFRFIYASKFTQSRCGSFHPAPFRRIWPKRWRCMAPKRDKAPNRVNRRKGTAILNKYSGAVDPPLGALPRDPTVEAARARYLDLIRRFHPDRHAVYQCGLSIAPPPSLPHPIPPPPAPLP